MFISNTLSISSSTGSAITSMSFVVSERSMNNFKCSQRTFDAKLTASSVSNVPFVYTSNVSLSKSVT